MALHDQDGSEIQDLGSLHHYRTEIPNIIFQMNLDPWEFKAYCVFKMTAGDKGRCFKSNNTLSDEVGCSIPTLIKIKSSLAEKNLIKITKQVHATGASMPDLIQITDIWPQNMQVMANFFPVNPKNDLKQWKKDDSKNNEGGKPDLVRGVNQVNGGGKPGLDKQDLKEQKQKEQQQDAAVSSISPFLEPLEISLLDKRWISENYPPEAIENAVNWAVHPMTKINTTLQQAIKWACVNQPKIPINPADEQQQNKVFAQQLEEQYQKKGIQGFSALSSYAEVYQRGGMSNNTVINYTEKGFKEQVLNALRKHGILK